MVQKEVAGMLLALYFQNLKGVDYIDPNLIEDLFSLRSLEEISDVKIFLQNHQNLYLELGENGTLVYPSYPEGGITCYIKRNGNGKSDHIPLSRDVKDKVHDTICHFLKMHGVDSFVITYDYPIDK